MGASGAILNDDLRLKWDLYTRGLKNSGWDSLLQRGIETVGFVGEAVAKPGPVSIAKAAMSVARTLTTSDLYYGEVLDPKQWKPMFPSCIKAQLLEVLEPRVTSKVNVSSSGDTITYLITAEGGVRIGWVKDGEDGVATEILAHVDNFSKSVEFARNLLWKTVDASRIVLSNAVSNDSNKGVRHSRGENHGQLRVSTDDLVLAASSKFATEYADYLKKHAQLGHNRTVLFYGPPGCHAKGQPIMMSDGSIKLVENVVVGDHLMAPGGGSRLVRALARGREEMVRIVPVKGESHTVNVNHILTLVRNNWKLNKRNKSVLHYELVDVTVKEWLTWSAGRKAAHKLVRSDTITFPKVKESLPLDPYILGVLIGDGSTKNGIRICSMDIEILDACESFSKECGLNFVEVAFAKCGKAKTFGITGSRSKSNGTFGVLRDLGLNVGSGEKFIPSMYKTASVEERRQLLAGLMDTDGHLDRSGCFDFCSKSERLANDVVFVARSLGFAAYVKPCLKRATNSEKKELKTYHRVSISGDLSSVPTRIPRKKSFSRKQIKNVRYTGFTVEHLPIDDFYGFNLDGDGRFLLGDFTISHNTGKSTIARTLCENLKLRSLRVRVEDVGSLGSGPVVEMMNIFNPDVVIFDDLDRAISQVALLETLENLHKRVPFVFATVNHIENLQQALIRPGRFDELIEIKTLDEAAVRKALGEECMDSFEVVKDWPIAFINEYVLRRKVLGKEKALTALDELRGRVDRLMGSSNGETPEAVEPDEEPW